ncbi:ATP-dependent 6-phosphofructokinase 1-like isoform X2 [Camellia sinensis]|uniref:ATP-dependent 6-phosphofructokinase 1-like isoform X2 n=1 Tax=Camellia sinensis TaxID=4442 RepID=UPI0010364AD6|nr:ATP-dependent 6-phosphofructokinase 1-like isoform X2 [Camellia sinensis]
MVIVIAEGAGQEFLSGSLQPGEERDPSGNRQLQDVGLWISNRIKEHFAKRNKMVLTLKYIVLFMELWPGTQATQVGLLMADKLIFLSMSRIGLLSPLGCAAILWNTK